MYTYVCIRMIASNCVSCFSSLQRIGKYVNTFEANKRQRNKHLGCVISLFTLACHASA